MIIYIKDKKNKNRYFSKNERKNVNEEKEMSKKRERNEWKHEQTNKRKKKIKIVKWYMIATTTTFEQCVNIYLLYKKIKSFDVKGLALSSYQLTKFLTIFVFVGVVIFEN